MVGANTFRNPALVAKMMTTIDHISGGRAVLGIGAAWFETEHTGFGIPFGDGPPERLRWLGQALPIMRGMLDGTEPTVTEGVYRTHAVRNDPPPVQRTPAHPHRRQRPQGDPPARGAVRATPATSAARSRRSARPRRRWSRTARPSAGTSARSSAPSAWACPSSATPATEARRVHASIFERNGERQPWEDQPVGTPEDVVERLAPFVELGYRHLICGFPSPYDEETMTRLATEVRPRLEAIARA